MAFNRITEQNAQDFWTSLLELHLPEGLLIDSTFNLTQAPPLS